MNNKGIIDLLVSKAHEKKLAPFYLIQNHSHLSPEELYQWMNQLLRELLLLDQRKGASELTAIVDVDTLILHTKERYYKVEQINSILQQLYYPSFTRKQRYWVIQDVHKCTPLIFNKLLKTLEAPPLDTSIFLLDSLQSEILPTVKSRAVTFRLSFGEKGDSFSATTHTSAHGKSFPLYLRENDPQLADIWQKQLPLNELAQKIQTLQGQDRFTELALNWCQAHLCQFDQCKHFLELVQFLDRQKLFYGRAQTQLALLIRQVMTMPHSLTL